MKRSREPSPEAAQTAANGNPISKRTFTIADDDDPYGFNVGVPGFLNKTKASGSKGGYVPGYLRVPGSSMNAAPPGTAPAKSARHTLTGPGSTPSVPSLPDATPFTQLTHPAAQPPTVPVPVTQPAQASAQSPVTPAYPAASAPAAPAALVGSAVPAVHAAPTTSAVHAGPAVVHAEPVVHAELAKPQLQQPSISASTQMPATAALPSPVWSPTPAQADSTSRPFGSISPISHSLDRQRVQNKALPEQHRLPEDMEINLSDAAKAAVNSKGPLSADMPLLPSFHEEVLKFVEQAAPNEAEQQNKATAFERIAAVSVIPFKATHAGQIAVQSFGSYANGLSLAESDIDVVVTGVLEPDDGHGGWLKQSRKQVTDNLFKIVKQLRQEHAVARGGSALQIIAGAKIPIVKLKTVEGVDVDISLGNDEGVKASQMLKTRLADHAAARPLTIVIKAFLKARRLTDVSTGGLGGYALVNMVIAHLQEEAKEGKHTEDLGQLLLGFLRRFGSHFSLYTDAVAIGLGGIVSKRTACTNGEDIHVPKLYVQDINTLREIAGGSKRITEVYEAFHSSAETLEQQAKTYGDEAPVDGWLQLLFETTPFTMREAAQMEQELPQQSGRPVLHQPRPHIMMAKSQPSQHGNPGFMQRKSGQANHKASFAGTAGTIYGAKPNNLASPPSKAVRGHAFANAPGNGPQPSSLSPPASTPPYATPPQVSPLPYPFTTSPVAPGASSSHAPGALGLPTSPEMMQQPYSGWPAPAGHPYMPAYQYQYPHQPMSQQMLPYMIAQTMPMTHHYGAPPTGPRPLGPRPPSHSPTRQ